MCSIRGYTIHNRAFFIVTNDMSIDPFSAMFTLVHCSHYCAGVCLHLFITPCRCPSPSLAFTCLRMHLGLLFLQRWNKQDRIGPAPSILLVRRQCWDNYEPWAVVSFCFAFDLACTFRVRKHHFIHRLQSIQHKQMVPLIIINLFSFHLLSRFCCYCRR